MPWKMTADEKAVEIKDGNPIWINDQNAETTVSGDTVQKLGNEAKQHRERATAAEAALAPFKDIDPVAAKKAIETMKNIDIKKLIDAGEVDKVRNEISASFQGQINELTNTNKTLEQRANQLRIDGVFAQSEFIRNEIAMPRDFFEANFKHNFKIGTDGNIEAYDKGNNRIYSKKNSGQYADPDEALSIMVDQHPQKAAILKAPNHSGSGNNGNGGNNNNGQRRLLRSDWEKLPPNEQAARAMDASKGILVIVDPN